MKKQTEPLTGNPNGIPVAVVASDMHFSLTPPPFRAGEKDWLAVEAGYLKQLCNLCRFPQVGVWDGRFRAELPCIIAGDIFDKWNAPHEVVSMVMENLPQTVYAIPGNHDLPAHYYDDAHRSAYGVLRAAGRLIDIKPGEPLAVEGPVPMTLYGFPCGYPVKPLKESNDLLLEVAVVHDYIWCDGYGFAGAEGPPPDKKMNHKHNRMCLQGYDVAIYGDNHKGFALDGRPPCIFNCGTFMRRRSDEATYFPQVGILYSNGIVLARSLNLSGDKYEENVKDDDVPSLNIQGFVEGLLELVESPLDFEAVVRRAVEQGDMGPDVKKVILSSLERGASSCQK